MTTTPEEPQFSEYDSLVGQKTNQALVEATLLVAELQERERLITFMESCTGGGLAYFITNVSGASGVFKGGLTTYSNEDKIAHGVPEAIIEQHGVYSMATALAMAKAALQQPTPADIAVGITGSLTRADPENSDSVVGEVYVGIVNGAFAFEHPLTILESDRMSAKLEVVHQTLQLLRNNILAVN